MTNLDYFGISAANHIGISAALTSITTGALGGFVYFKDRRSKLYRVFSLYSFCIALWSAFLTVHVFATNKDVAVFTGKYLHVGAALIPVLFLHFVTEFFADRKKQLVRSVLPGLYVIALIFIVLCFNG